MSNKPVLAIGEILIDLIVSDDAPSLETANAFNARAGGAPANVAVAVARENFERNGYPLDSPQVVTAVGSAAARGERQWQVVVANILAHILIEIMADLRAALAPAGRLILSGIIAEQEGAMLAALAAHNLRIIERHTMDDWVAFVVELE